MARTRARAAATAATAATIKADNNVDIIRNCPDSRKLRIKRVAIYLILRHALPSASGIIGAFEYTLFRTRPSLIQSTSLFMSLCTLVSSWLYGLFIAKQFANIQDISWIIIIATILTSLWSLLFIPFYQIFREALSNVKDDDYISGDNYGDSNDYQVPLNVLVLFILYQIIQSFLGEIYFLPSVILATNTVVSINNDEGDNHDTNENCDSLNDDGDSFRNNESATIVDSDVFDDNYQDEVNVVSNYLPWYLDDGILYGFMISCIDFGDQLGDWFAGPIVKALNIKRGNEWENLNWFVVISAALTILSISFLRILWKSSKPVDRY